MAPYSLYCGVRCLCLTLLYGALTMRESLITVREIQSPPFVESPQALLFAI